MSLSTSDLATLFDELRASGVLTVPDFVDALNARGVPALDGRLGRQRRFPARCLQLRLIVPGATGWRAWSGIAAR